MRTLSLSRLDCELQQLVKNLEIALQNADQGVAGVRGAWISVGRRFRPSTRRSLGNFRSLELMARSLFDSDAGFEELRPLRERLGQVRRVEKEHGDRRRAWLVEWEDLKANEFRRLDSAAKTVNQSSETGCKSR